VINSLNKASSLMENEIENSDGSSSKELEKLMDERRGCREHVIAKTRWFSPYETTIALVGVSNSGRSLLREVEGHRDQSSF